MIQPCDPPPDVARLRGAAYGVMALRSQAPILELARSERATWPAETRQLHVAFLDGDALLHDLVEEAATGAWSWPAVCGLDLVFDQREDAEIRITFARGGSWSRLGVVSAVGWERGEPSMQLGWLGIDTPADEIRRVVTHELGHALGFIHEHQSPAADIPWNEPAVMAHYQERMGWSENMVRANVLDGWEAEDCTNYSQYDPLSVMAYWIDPSWVLDETYAHGGNVWLSPLDRQMAQQWFGPRVPRRWHEVRLPWITRT